MAKIGKASDQLSAQEKYVRIPGSAKRYMERANPSHIITYRAYIKERYGESPEEKAARRRQERDKIAVVFAAMQNKATIASFQGDESPRQTDARQAMFISGDPTKLADQFMRLRSERKRQEFIEARGGWNTWRVFLAAHYNIRDDGTPPIDAGDYDDLRSYLGITDYYVESFF